MHLSPGSHLQHRPQLRLQQQRLVQYVVQQRRRHGALVGAQFSKHAGHFDAVQERGLAAGAVLAVVRKAGDGEGAHADGLPEHRVRLLKVGRERACGGA